MGLVDLAVWQWTLFAFVVLFFGVAKGGFGAGIGFLAMPILALALPPLLALGLLAPLLVFADALNLRLYWRQWSWQNLRMLVPTMLLGVGLGWLFFSLISAAGLRLAIGAMALLAAADNLHRIRGGAMRRWPLWTAPFFGLAVGVSSTIAHAGGRRPIFTSCRWGWRSGSIRPLPCSSLRWLIWLKWFRTAFKAW